MYTYENVKKNNCDGDIFYKSAKCFTAVVDRKKEKQLCCWYKNKHNSQTNQNKLNDNLVSVII